MAISRPPWTLQQITRLWERQKLGHPYTCLYHSDIGLVPLNTGWECPVELCDYQQTWAYQSDTDGPPYELRGTA